MDTVTQKTLDTLLEDELRRGFRIKELPAEERAILAARGFPDIERVRFVKPTLAKKNKIAQVTHKSYVRDLKDPDVPSDDQMKKLVEERGEWTKVHQDRLEELQRRTKVAMDELYIDGIGEGDWYREYLESAKAFREAILADDKLTIEDRAEIDRRFTRWVEYLPSKKALYNEQYAAEQGGAEYSVDRDLSWLLDRAPNQATADLLQALDDLRDKLVRFSLLLEERQELVELENKQEAIFAHTAEGRRRATETLATMYFCIERVNEQLVPVGPVAPTFEEMYALPEEVLTWLQIEFFFYMRATPDEYRDYLSTFGFLKADRATKETATDAPSSSAPSNGESEPSAESPALPSSKADSTPPRDPVSLSLG